MRNSQRLEESRNKKKGREKGLKKNSVLLEVNGKKRERKAGGEHAKKHSLKIFIVFRQPYLKRKKEKGGGGDSSAFKRERK